MGVNIGQAAKASGLSERMLRYFEKQGLIPAPTRSDGGYRSYTDDDVRRMRTIALAQDVGFSPEAIRQLLAKIDEAKAEISSADVEAEALAELDRKTEALAELRGRIGSMLDRARARLDDDEPDIDWGPPSPPSMGHRSAMRIVMTVEGPAGVERPRVRRAHAAEHGPAAGPPRIVGDVDSVPKRDLTPA